jgi:hypothetical protein
VAGAKKYKYNTKNNTNTYDTKYTPPSGVLFFPARGCTLHAWPQQGAAAQHSLAIQL